MYTGSFELNVGDGVAEEELLEELADYAPDKVKIAEVEFMDANYEGSVWAFTSKEKITQGQLQKEFKDIDPELKISSFSIKPKA